MITYDNIHESIVNIVDKWGEAGKAVVALAYEEHKKISMNDFLSHCTMCGGNWGGMLLTGIKELYPKTYEAIPDDMGVFAFSLICETMLLCGVDTSE